MFGPLTFGDIFRYYENEYVFLVGTEEGIVYAAKILNKRESNWLEKFSNKKCGSPGAYKTEDNILYYFVKLTSKGVEDRLAHFKSTGTEDTRITAVETGIKLNQADKNKIKEEIVNSGNVLPKELKNLVKELDI